MSAAEDRTSAVPPAQPPAKPLALVLGYMLAGVVLAMAQGLGQGFVSANVQQFAGDLGISATDASWLMAACAASLVAGMATGPFAMQHFNRTAVYGLIANMATAPLTFFLYRA